MTLSGPARPRAGPELRQLSIIEDGAMLVRDGKIANAGTRSEIEKLIDKDCEIVDAGGRVVLPGFVDAHAHPVFAGTRANEFEERAEGATYQEIAARGGGIQSTVEATRAATLDELVAASKRYANWFLRNGTTTVEAKSGYGLTLEDELKILRAIRRLDTETELRYVATFLGAHVIPSEYKSRRDDYVSLLIDEMLPRVAAEKLAEYCDVFCEANVFTTDESWKILSAARCHGLGYALGSRRYPAAREMIDAGLAVVLATDFNPGSSPTPSMGMILSLAWTQMKMTPAESITAATINAAYSLNRGERIGSLEVGKLADFVIHDCDDYRELAYFFGIEHPWRVYAGARQVFARSL